MSFFTQKLGPLPLWAWAAVVLVAVGGYMLLKGGGLGNLLGGGGSSAPASATPTGLTDSLGNFNAPLGALGGRGAGGVPPLPQGPPPIFGMGPGGAKPFQIDPNAPGFGWGGSGGMKQGGGLPIGGNSGNLTIGRGGNLGPPVSR